MTEEQFIQAVNNRAHELGINPILLLSGIEGIYTFKDVPLNGINYELLDSLIMTIFALRIGDQFHELAQNNLEHADLKVRLAAERELSEIDQLTLISTENPYLRSFAQVLNGRSPIRHYHEKALEVAAIEIRKLQVAFNNDSIGVIVLAICKDDQKGELGLSTLFNA
jgi:hypothetical protein